jgi:hypothetical protein
MGMVVTVAVLLFFGNLLNLAMLVHSLFEDLKSGKI